MEVLFVSYTFFVTQKTYMLFISGFLEALLAMPPLGFWQPWMAAKVLTEKYGRLKWIIWPQCTYLKMNMEHNHGLVQIICLSKWLICRFQPLGVYVREIAGFWWDTICFCHIMRQNCAQPNHVTQVDLHQRTEATSRGWTTSGWSEVCLLKSEGRLYIWSNYSNQR